MTTHRLGITFDDSTGEISLTHAATDPGTRGATVSADVDATGKGVDALRKALKALIDPNRDEMEKRLAELVAAINASAAARDAVKEAQSRKGGLTPADANPADAPPADVSPG